MCKDPQKGDDVLGSEAFNQSVRKAANQLDRSSAGEHSLSGQEPNRFFMNMAGQQFDDLSALSAMDHRGDGRSVVRWDYDHDGWVDWVSINSNRPKLIWYRNQIGDLLEKTGRKRHFLAFQFEGSNGEPKPNRQRSSRDAYGLRLEVKTPKRSHVVELRGGEGFSAQQSKTLIVGLGEESEIKGLELVWPSGKRERFDMAYPVNHLIRLKENEPPEVSPY